MDWKKAIHNEKNTYQIPENWLYIHYFEAFNSLFRLENTLRILVYIILKEKFLNKWQECTIKSDGNKDISIKNIAKYRIKVDKNYGYIGYNTTNPLMYLTGGELINIITDRHWDLFEQYFPGNLKSMKLKLDEIKNIRNALAHFRPIKDSDVDIIKINSKQVFPKIEKRIYDIVNSNQALPSNTKIAWYKKLNQISLDKIKLSFVQTSCKNWIRIKIVFNLPIIDNFRFGDTIYYNIIKPQPTEILEKFPNLRKYIVICSENLPYYQFNFEKPVFFKGISFTFSKKTLQTRYRTISNEMQRMLTHIIEDYELITNNKSAKDELVKLINVSSQLIKKENYSYWENNDSIINTSINELYPVEFWSSSTKLSENFVSSAERFPWMVDKISEKLVSDLPF